MSAGIKSGKVTTGMLSGPPNIQVFLDPSNKQEQAWRAMVDGVLLSPTWNAKEIAEAGAVVEIRRMAARRAAQS